jgi:serine acetyltransferase
MAIPCYIPIVNMICSFMAINWDRGIVGFVLRGVYWKTKLGHMGVDVFIDRGVTFYPETKNISIGNHCHIDTNTTFATSGGRLLIKDNVVIASNCYLNCRPFIEIGNCVSIACNCILLAVVTQMDDKGMITPPSAMAPGHTSLEYGIIMDDFSALSPSVTIAPKPVDLRHSYAGELGALKIGYLSIVGINAFLDRSVGIGEIWTGSPAKKLSDLKQYVIDTFNKDHDNMKYYGWKEIPEFWKASN